MSEARLAALWMRSSPRRAGQSGWHGVVSQGIEHLGCSTCRSGQAIDAWPRRPERRWTLDDGGRAVDGWRLSNLWLGPRGRALAVRPRTIYLRPDGSRDTRPEHVIVGERKPPWPLQQRRQALVSLLDRLQVTCRPHLQGPVRLDAADPNPQNAIRLLGSTDAFPADTNSRIVHKQGGFLSVRDGLEVLICGDANVARAPMDDYSERAKDAFERRGVHGTIMRVIALGALEARLAELDQGGTPERRDVPVLFMLGHKGEPPSNRMIRVMGRMDRHCLPWRRAYATDDRNWSVSDQIGSLLQAAGGTSHAVALAGGELMPWSIGIDVSKRDDYSRVATSLVNPNGQLAGSWMLDQARQENIEPDVLRRLLDATADKVPPEDRSSGILVIRDGRVFESENVDDYMRDLGAPVTLVELRKYGNPPLLLDREARLPPGPVAGWLPQVGNGTLGFLVTLPNSTQERFDNPLKIWMPDAWDGLRLGPERLARILYAQTLTPGLGVRRRRLPAPVYWADGIAGASDNDLRFRGQCAVDLN